MRTDLLRLVLAGLLGFALASTAAPAWAQDDDDDIGMDDDDDGDPGDGEPMGDDDDDDGGMGGDGATTADGTAEVGAAVAKMGLILPEGKLMIGGGVTINFSADAVFKPLALNPDVWYGVMPKLMAGLVHSPQAFTGFFAGAGGGLCLTGTDNGCGDVYDSPGLVARYELMSDDALDLAFDGGLLFLSLSEFTLTLKAGVVGRWVSGKIAVWFNPNIWLGLTDRSVDVMGVEIPINKERLNLPVGVTYAATPEVKVGVQTGIAGFLDGFGDSWAGVLSAGGFYALNPTTHVGLVFSFNDLYGANSTADARSLQLTGSKVF